MWREAACRNMWGGQRNGPSRQGTHTEETNTHTVRLWELEGLDTMSLYNQWDLEPGALQVSCLSTEQARRESDSWVATLKERAARVEKQHKNGSLHDARGKRETGLFIRILERGGGLL